MTLPFALPDWLPWWVPIVLLVPSLLYALLFLVMPFNVFGVKGRLDAMEARLDDIQADIRSLARSLPEPLRNSGYDDAPYVAPMPEPRRPSAAAIAAVPRPLPPPPQAPDPHAPVVAVDAAYGRIARGSPRRDTGRVARSEPRLD